MEQGGPSPTRPTCRIRTAGPQDETRGTGEYRTSSTHRLMEELKKLGSLLFNGESFLPVRASATQIGGQQTHSHLVGERRSGRGKGVKVDSEPTLDRLLLVGAVPRASYRKRLH